MNINEKILNKFHDELYIRGYPQKTIDGYAYHCRIFLDWVKKDARLVTQKDIKTYQKMLRKKGLAHATINIKVQSIKSFFVRYMKRRFYDLRSMKKQEKHTGVIRREVIVEVINKTSNLKHRLLIELLYGSALRIGEAVRVLIKDIDVDEKIVIIRQGKGQRDREATLSELFVKDYQRYMRGKNLKYLFEGRDGHISIRTGQEIINKLFRKHAKKKAHPHMMRASFATHLFEQGIDSRIIQVYTGHKNNKSFSPYLSYAKRRMNVIKSPLDS